MKLTCIQLDWAANPVHRVTQADWEAKVWSTIREIAGPNFRTGRAVLRALERTGKAVRVVPWREPDPLQRMQKETPDNREGLCPSGLGLAQAAPESSAVIMHVRPKSGAGTGDSLVLFTAQDFRLAGELVDSVLLHELFHCLRIALDLNKGSPNLPPPTEVMGHWKGSTVGKAVGRDPETRYTQIYNNVEEFLAVVIQNIYDSERRRPLRRDHLAPTTASMDKDYCFAPGSELRWATLAPQLSNSRNFLAVWRHQIELLVSSMRSFCNEIAPIDAHFNPIFELYAQRDWFLPGGREVNARRR